MAGRKRLLILNEYASTSIFVNPRDLLSSITSQSVLISMSLNQRIQIKTKIVEYQSTLLTLNKQQYATSLQQSNSRMHQLQVGHQHQVVPLNQITFVVIFLAQHPKYTNQFQKMLFQ